MATITACDRGHLAFWGIHSKYEWRFGVRPCSRCPYTQIGFYGACVYTTDVRSKAVHAALMLGGEKAAREVWLRRTPKGRAYVARMKAAAQANLKYDK